MARGRPYANELRECLGYCLDVLGGERKLHFVGRHADIGITTLGFTLANLILVRLIERPDVDYGYVGAGRGKISLYRQKECVAKNIPEAEAVERLLQLIDDDRKKQ